MQDSLEQNYRIMYEQSMARRLVTAAATWTA